MLGKRKTIPDRRSHESRPRKHGSVQWKYGQIGHGEDPAHMNEEIENQLHKGSDNEVHKDRQERGLKGCVRPGHISCRRSAAQMEGSQWRT